MFRKEIKNMVWLYHLSIVHFRKKETGRDLAWGNKHLKSYTLSFKIKTNTSYVAIVKPVLRYVTFWQQAT